MKKVSREDVDEVCIYDNIKTIVMEEVERIKKEKERDSEDFKNLFLLTRTYGILKDDLRDDLKYGTFEALGIAFTEAELEE